MLGVAVVGLGKAAKTIHLPSLAAMPGVKLASVWDENQQAVADVVHHFPDARACTSLEDICQDESVDAAIVSTPPDSHHDIGMALIRAKIPILIEKPLAPTYGECKELLTLASRLEVPLAVGHSKRFHPTLVLVREAISNGLIGAPFFIGAHWATDVKLNPRTFIPTGYENYWWRWRDPNIGGGILQDHLPHYVDLARYWTGAEPTRVLAYNMNVARDWLGWQDIESVWEDMSVSLVEMDSGCLLRLETGVVGRSISPLLGLGHGVGEWTEYAYILGSKGKIVIDLHPWESTETGRVAVWTTEGATEQGKGWTLIEQPEPDRLLGPPSGTALAGFRAQTEAFIRWLRRPDDIPTTLATGSDGALSVACVEAAYESARLGRWFEIDQVLDRV